MKPTPDAEDILDERRRHQRVQDAVGLHVRRPGEADDSSGRPTVRRANRYDIKGYADVRRDQPDVAAYIDELEERIRQLLLDGEPVGALPTHKVSLSAGGMAFADKRLFEPGETLGVTLTLFSQGDAGPRRVAFDARVVSANDAPEVANGDRPNYRLVFEHMSDADRDALVAHVMTLRDARPDADD